MWEATLQGGMRCASNAADIAGHVFGFVLGTGLACSVGVIRLKTDITDTGSGGRGESRHAGGAG